MDYRALLKNVEKTLGAIDATDDIASTIVSVGEAVVTNFQRELGISGGRLWVNREGQYVLERGFGRSKKAPSGMTVAATYAPLQRAEEDGLVLTDIQDPSVDQDLERKLGVNRFAAISFGEGKYLISFDVNPRVKAEDLLMALGIIRTVVDSKVRTEKLEGLLNEARRIQQSILPRTMQDIGDYEFWGISSPAEDVGGDFFDYIPLGEGTFGCAVADASGHGLLAALLVRDVYVGLRMGIGRDFKIARTIERLNRILNKSRLTTKFVSLFYAEFETNGEIVYVNAGHPSPFLLGSAGAFQELPSSGMVLGPSPDATYARRAAKMEPGDILVMYSDGIIEAHDGRGREFGIARLRKLVAEFRKRPAREIAELVLSGVRAYTSGRMAEDDQTIVIVRRKPSPKRSSASGEFPAITNVRLGRS